MKKLAVRRFNGGALWKKTAKADAHAVVRVETDEHEEAEIILSPETAFESLTTIVSLLGSLVSNDSSQRAVIGAQGWKLENSGAPLHHPLLHVYLEGSVGARLTFLLQPDHLQPLGEMLLAESRRKRPVAPKLTDKPAGRG